MVFPIYLFIIYLNLFLAWFLIYLQQFPNFPERGRKEYIYQKHDLYTLVF